MQQLAVELLDLVDHRADRLLVTRLELQGGHPVRQLAGRAFAALHTLTLALFLKEEGEEVSFLCDKMIDQGPRFALLVPSPWGRGLE